MTHLGFTSRIKCPIIHDPFGFCPCQLLVRILIAKCLINYDQLGFLHLSTSCWIFDCQMFDQLWPIWTSRSTIEVNCTNILHFQMYWSNQTWWLLTNNLPLENIVRSSNCIDQTSKHNSNLINLNQRSIVPTFITCYFLIS